MKKMELTDADEQQLIEEVLQLGGRLCYGLVFERTFKSISKIEK